MSRPIREIESDLDDAIKARQAAEKAWDARVVMGNRWDEGWVRAQELDRLKTRVADLSGELRKAQQAALDAALIEQKETFADSLVRRSWEAHRAALAEPEKERAETGIPARSVGVGSGETDPSRGAAYREHVTDGSPCWCNPELNYRDPDTGTELWIHRREQ